MKSQLTTSPYPVFRQEANTPDNFETNCPGVSDVKESIDDEVKDDVNRAVYCSHQKIYDRANTQVEKADFYINMEDDVKITNESLFWEKLQEFLEGGCAEEKWDMIAVDTFGPGKLHRKTECSSPETGGKHYMHVFSNKRGGRWGSHFTIWKAESLPKLLNRRMHIIDHFERFRQDNITVRFWQPELLAQLSSKASSLGYNDTSLPPGCGEGVRKEDNVWKWAKGFRCAKGACLDCGN